MAHVAYCLSTLNLLLSSKGRVADVQTRSGKQPFTQHPCHVTVRYSDRVHTSAAALSSCSNIANSINTVSAKVTPELEQSKHYTTHC
jgi:hypothetical protein